MQEKIYILMASSGAYDDYRTHIIGIYSSMEMAEIGRSEYSEAITKFFDDNPCPVDPETAEKIEAYDVTIDDNDIIELYNNWSFKTDGVSSICKDPWIVESFLNKTDLGLIEDRTKYL